MTIPRTLRKYPNRRLYDTARRAYITLGDVRELIIGRIPFVVIDSRSETDVTHSVLMQVLTLTEHMDPQQILRLIRAQRRHPHRAAST